MTRCFECRSEIDADYEPMHVVVPEENAVLRLHVCEKDIDAYPDHVCTADCTTPWEAVNNWNAAFGGGDRGHANRRYPE